MERALAGAVSHVYNAAGGQMNRLLRCEPDQCGSGLAREDGVSVNVFVSYETAFASKPAPTLTEFGSGGRHG